MGATACSCQCLEEGGGAAQRSRKVVVADAPAEAPVALHGLPFKDLSGGRIEVPRQAPGRRRPPRDDPLFRRRHRPGLGSYKKAMEPSADVMAGPREPSAVMLTEPSVVAASFAASVRAEALAKLQRARSSRGLSDTSGDTCSGDAGMGDCGTAPPARPPREDRRARANDGDEVYISSSEVSSMLGQIDDSAPPVPSHMERREEARCLYS
mmetsp:Transcript_7618/g.21326  ORF Transcript_7618/g.21326 Transcript_7618/m.21326 type:complete len:210 (-) Transcript_7618:173-802(-)